MHYFKLLITVGPDYDNYSLLCYYADILCSSKKGKGEPLIVSDAGQGAGILGERYAAENGLEVAEFLRDNDHPSSILKVFKIMMAYADMCLFFRNGQTQGTDEELFAIAKKGGSETLIITY